MTLEQGQAARERIHRFSEIFGSLLVESFHFLALFGIGATIVWSAVYSFIGMTAKGHAPIDDILLLFIYLELGAMVGIYFKTTRMPVRFLIYVAITALTRLLLEDIQMQHKAADWGILMVAGAILLLAVANLVVRYGSARFPSAGRSDRP
jgi:phosphate starvation-inducible membrane PsiE